MKNNKFTKISLVILTLALCVGAVFAMSISADEPAAQNAEATGPVIVSQNIDYNEMFRIMYAVDPETVKDTSKEITLCVYDVDPEVDTSKGPIAEMKATLTTDAEKLGNLVSLGYSSAYIFTTTKGVSYNNMLQNFYARAVDSDGTKGPVKRYSVAEYFYQQLASNPTDEVAKATYENAIAFGASVQQLLAKQNNTNPTLVSDVRYVVIAENDNSVLDGKWKSGVYAKNTKLPVSYPDSPTTEWTVVAYDAAGNEIDGTRAEKQTEVIVPAADGVAKVLVTTGAITSYRDGYDNFNNLEETEYSNSNLPSWADSIHANYKVEGVKMTDGHGMVAKITGNENSGNSSIYLNHTDTRVAAADAKALEVSFDIKLDTEKMIANQRAWIRLPATGVTYQPNLTLTNSTSEPRTLHLQDFGGEKYGYTLFNDIYASDWVNIRIVMYKDSKFCYVYVNGNTEDYLRIDRTTQSTFAYTGDITSISSVEIRCTNSSTFYIDNLYCGYISDANPHDETTTTPADN